MASVNGTATPPRRERDVAGPVLIVVPSLLSGAGLVLILISIFLDNEIAQQTLLTIGVILLWVEFFTTMVIFRYSLRSINRRLRRIELGMDRAEGGNGDNHDG